METLESCPKCSHRLGPPLKSSGRQVCMKCGWASRPRTSAGAAKSKKRSLTKTPPRDDISPMEIQKILAEAAEKSLNNMKSRNSEESSEPKS